MWCAIVAGEICSESSDRLGSATAAGTVRDSVFKHCVLLSWVLKLDDQTLLHLRVKGIANDLNRFCGRNVLWCAGDGGRGVCSSDVHRLVQKPVSAAEMQFPTPHEAPELAKFQAESYVGVRQTLPLELAHGTVLRWRNRFFNWYMKSCAVQQQP